MHVLSPWLRTPVALLCAAPLLAQSQEADLSERLYFSGDRAYAAKAYKEALDTWSQLLQAAPKSSHAPRVLLRMAHHQLDVEYKPEAALPFLERLRTDYIKAPEAAEGLLLRGTLLARQAQRPGDLKDAMAEFNRVLDLFPQSPACSEARLQLGRAWRDQGNLGRALECFLDAFHLQEDSPVAPQAMLEAALSMDALGDLPSCLKLLQRLRTKAPESPEAQEASWRTLLLVRHRLQKTPLRNEGPWPAGRTKWLKTPTVLATAPDGELLIFQNDLDHVFHLRGAELLPQGPPAPGTRILLNHPSGQLWILTKAGLIKGDAPVMPLGALSAVSGAALDRWGTLWVADAKTPALTLFPAEGTPRTVASPTATALVPLSTGGFVMAADADRKLLFLDAEGQPRFIIPYGKDLPTAFRTVTALATDGAGQVAALVDGGDYGEGIVILGPDGALLRQATLKALGISGRITSLAMDRDGGIILCDRRNDVLFRLK